MSQDFKNKQGFCKRCDNVVTFKDTGHHEGVNRMYECRRCGQKETEYYLDTIPYQVAVRALIHETKRKEVIQASFESQQA